MSRHADKMIMKFCFDVFFSLSFLFIYDLTYGNSKFLQQPFVNTLRKRSWKSTTNEVCLLTRWEKVFANLIQVKYVIPGIFLVWCAFISLRALCLHLSGFKFRSTTEVKQRCVFVMQFLSFLYNRRWLNLDRLWKLNSPLVR